VATPRARELASGKGWSPGAAGPSPRLCAAAPGAGCPPPGPRPRSGPHGEPAATNARAGERANGNGREHQGDDAEPGSIRRSSNLGTCAVQGEDRSPNRHRESLMSPGTCQERLRRPFGIGSAAT
jgi:hypothetical protein